MNARTTLTYALVALVLALGAPLGWLAYRALAGDLRGGLGGEVSQHRALYAYLLMGTSLSFVAAGVIAGRLAQKLKDANARLLGLATTDALTGLCNTRHFHSWLRTECARADRESAHLALIMVDLDEFKRLNDRLGHATGDVALAHAARVIGDSIRRGDVACRVGGEEFTVICPNCDKDEALRIAERIRATLEASPVATSAGAQRITASFGVALYRAKEGPSRFYERVDAAMYAAKKSGRNRVSLALAPAA